MNAANRTNRGSGFTLLELIIVVSLIALLAGVIAPGVGGLMRSRQRRSTIEELQQVADACVAYYDDVDSFPGALLELMADTSAGWSGPYLQGTVDDPWAGASGYTIDGFGNAYRLSVSGFEATVTSDGADRTAATADDLSLTVSVVPVLRRKTQSELAAINAAVTQYNAVYLSTDPLPASWPVALARLEAAGYLPSGGGFDEDGWGVAYEGDPAGVAPLTRVRSTNVGS